MRRGLVVDLFAGGGGASTGLEAALGRKVDVALDHDETAIAVHTANHPGTKHFTADIWAVDPKIAVGGRRVDVLWASPDCTTHSRARAGKPREKGKRVLAEAALKWIRALLPPIYMMENVEEFTKWGPLDDAVQPIKEREGESFRLWVGKLRLMGYQVEWRVLDASKYGAPTKRRRLFLVARLDGLPIVWPEPTHGPGLLPVRTAAECIDWSLPCPSIFTRKKPLAEKTLARIAEGIRRYVLESPKPFIVKVNHGRDRNRSASVDEPLSTITATQRGDALVGVALAKFRGTSPGQPMSSDPGAPLPTISAGGIHSAVVEATLYAPALITTGYGERPGQTPRTSDLHAPLNTAVAGGVKQALAAVYLVKHYSGVYGQPIGKPASTITAQDHHSLAELELTMTGHAPAVVELLSRYGVATDKPIMVDGVPHWIADIGMRMLEPDELLRAQFGRFAADYDLSAAKTKAAKVRLVGNSVCLEMAEALVRANCVTERAVAA